MSSSRGLRVVAKRKRIISVSSSDDDDYSMPIRRKRQREYDIAEESEGSSSKRYCSSEGLINLTELISVLDTKNKSSITSQQMLNALPEFDPNNQSQNVEKWLHKVNEYARIYNWDDRQTSHYATQKLMGTAKKWFYSLPSLDFSWNEWQVKLRRAFPIEDNYANLLEEMFARKTKPDESLSIYFYDKLLLLNRCDITGKKAVDCLIHGIADVSLRNSAQALKCEDPEDLLKHLVVQQPQSYQLPQTQKKRFFKAIRCFKCRKETVYKAKCFNCNEEGHRFANCPKVLLKCSLCNKYGHSINNCNRSSSSNQDNVKTERVLNIDSDNILKGFTETIQKEDDVIGIRTKVKETIEAKQDKLKNNHNTKTASAKQYNVNDLVKITKVSFNENIGKSKKLLPKFVGPYKVTKVLGNDRYKIDSIPGFNNKKKYSTVVAADRMRPWINVKALDVFSEEDSSSESDSQ